MTESGTNTSLWSKRRQVSTPEQGPYFDIRQELFKIMAQAKRLSLLTETAPQTYERQCIAYPSGVLTSATVAVEANFKTKWLRIAVSVNEKGIEHTRYFDLTENGMAVDLDEMSPQEEEWRPLAYCIQTILRILKDAVDRALTSKRKRRRKYWIRVCIVMAAIITAVAIALFIELVPVRQYNEEVRARAQYDAGNPQLEGTSYSIGAHSLNKVAEGTPKSVPSYGANDRTLDHPRTITISPASRAPYWCKDITVDIPSGRSLVVAAEETSPFIRDHYVATYIDRTLTICLVDGFAKTQDADSDLNVKLILQAKSQDSAN